MARIRYNDEALVEFNRLREQRLQNPDEPPTTKEIPEKEIEQEKRKEQEKEQEKGKKHDSEVIDLETQIDPKILQQW